MSHKLMLILLFSVFFQTPSESLWVRNAIYGLSKKQMVFELYGKPDIDLFTSLRRRGMVNALLH